jgi:hypothetical protein
MLPVGSASCRLSAPQDPAPSHRLARFQTSCFRQKNDMHSEPAFRKRRPTFWIACARWPAPTSQNLPSRRVLPSVPTVTVRGRQADPLVGLMGCSVCARGGSARRCYAFCCLRGGPVNRCKGDSATECTVLRGRSDGWRGGSPGRQGCSCGLGPALRGDFGHGRHGGTGAAHGAGGGGAGGHLRRPRAARRGPAAAGRARAAAH